MPSLHANVQRPNTKNELNDPRKERLKKSKLQSIFIHHLLINTTLLSKTMLKEHTPKRAEYRRCLRHITNCWPARSSTSSHLSLPLNNVISNQALRVILDAAQRIPEPRLSNP